MLINFSVENFRSFGTEQTLNLVASRAQKGPEDHCIDIAGVGERVLRAAVIYGANAAGKSNLVRAIDFARDLILEGPGPMKRIALNQFRFTAESDKPSSFEFRFLVGNRVYVYGFDVTKDEVAEEWLSATGASGRETDVFHRKGKKIEFANPKKFDEINPTSLDALKALKLLGVRPNQLLLNKIVDLDVERRGELLHEVVWWFTECLTVIPAAASFGPILEYLDGDGGFRDFAAAFLASIGTGIGSVAVEQTRIGADQLPKQLVEHLQSRDDVEHQNIILGPGMSLNLDPDDPAKVIRRNLAAQHTVGDRDFSLPFDEESDGTQRFLHLLPALYHLHTSCKVYVIDELDRSLHPLLSHALLKFFVESCPGACQQLIVTTHETHLLDQDLLRRDEIWFTEKDKRQQTHLYSLTDLKVRKDLRIERSYLQGRFGAIPFVGGMEKLKQLIECPPEE
ncbi:MAG: AAA family ATPase [Planctomycetaceae bacterium]|nr:ATP/GTP-binding protein [Planctomycetales bacterium]MCB9924336.1 AAA family ATPase [Planctomycetaceae bacterium]